MALTSSGASLSASGAAGSPAEFGLGLGTSTPGSIGASGVPLTKGVPLIKPAALASLRPLNAGIVTVESEPQQIVIPRPLLPGEGSEAFYAWGDAARLAEPDRLDNPDDNPDAEGTPGFNTKTDKKDKKDPNKNEVFPYEELLRVFDVIKVESDDDPDINVDIERITRILFTDKDNDVHDFKLTLFNKDNKVLKKGLWRRRPGGTGPTESESA